MKPTKMPRNTIHIKTIIKEKMKTLNVASNVNKNGINGTIPPKSGANPFTNDTIMLANLSAFSCNPF